MAVSKASIKQPPAEAQRSGQQTNSTNSQVTCVISKDTIIEGSFSAQQDVRLDGQISGDVRCAKRLVMGESGRIEGTVIADTAVIMGLVEGEVRIKDSLHLKSTAVINGKILARSILVDEGAKYNGECRVGSME